MSTRPRTCGALLALVLLVGASACSDGDPAPHGSADGNGGGDNGGIGADFPAKDVIISASCTPGTTTEDTATGAVISVDGWQPETWKHLAHAEFPLPDGTVVDGTVDSAVEELCAPANTGDRYGSISTVRSLFDRDFTKIAVVTQDLSNGETHVGYVDRKGKFTDLTGDGGFGDEPEEEAAAFAADGDDVWLTYERRISYEEGSKTVVATRPVRGDHTRVDHWEGDNAGDLLTIVGSPGKAVLGLGAYLSPDGRHIATTDGVVSTPQGKVVDGEAAVEENDLTNSSCSPKGWLGNNELLCTAPNNFAAAGLAPEAEPGSPILPDNTNANFAMTISPDGDQFTLISRDGERVEHWMSGTAPGSTPEKIKPSGAFAALGGTPIFVEWR